MTRNFKLLGLALVAVLAMSAFVASVASAANFTAEGGSTTLTGKQEGSDVFTTDAGTVTCNTVTYVGEVVGTSATSASATPTYANCTAFGFLNVVIDVNNCFYEFTSGTKEANGNFEGSVHIRCPAGKSIEITAPGCTTTVGEQTPTGGTITYTNVGTGTTREITIDVALNGIHYTEDNAAPLNNCKFPGITTTNGTYSGHAIVTGETKGTTTHTGISVS